MSLAASERASSASQLGTRVRIRYASRRATAGDHAGRAVDGAGEVGSLAVNALVRDCVTVLGAHRSVPSFG
jgi:tRNA A37 threonylcarbamoyladenosine dehydratase